MFSFSIGLINAAVFAEGSTYATIVLHTLHLHSGVSGKCDCYEQWILMIILKLAFYCCWYAFPLLYIFNNISVL